MSKFTNKKLDRGTINRIIIVSIILIVDLTLLPWIIQFPRFLVKKFITAPIDWLKFGWFNSMKLIFTDARYRNMYMFLQLAVLTLIIAVAWNVDNLKKKNRITDGVGGPEPTGDGQFGTSRWQDKKEMDRTCTVWRTDTELEECGGIIFGMEKSSKGKEKVWLNQDDLHTLILGATRSGKSRKIILPSIWELGKTGESMVVGDPKGELYISTRDYLEKQGYKVTKLR